MGLLRNEIISDEDACNREKWKAKQPKMIWKEMTNKEIVKRFEIINLIYGETYTVGVFLNNDGLFLNKYKIIKGILHKKIKNPYNRMDIVISAD
jgi:hypothetical protein